MNVNGVTGAYNAYSNYSTEAVKTTTQDEKNVLAPESEAAAVYEPSSEATATETVTKSSSGKIANPELFAQLKADADARTEQLRQIVEQLMTKQAGTFGKATDMWKFLASGEYTVDAATKAQAQADISEDGYWGVKQTSDRILDFAVALAGDDKDKLGDMLNAFKEGYKKAEETWGGKLPEISQKTYDAVLEKFDKLINGTEEN